MSAPSRPARGSSTRSFSPARRFPRAESSRGRYTGGPAPSPDAGMAVRTPDVELLWWEGCPSTEDALAMLREEMAALGLDPELVDVREVSSDADAQRERFVGSPTIRVDGRDVQPVPDE